MLRCRFLRATQNLSTWSERWPHGRGAASERKIPNASSFSWIHVGQASGRRAALFLQPHAKVCWAWDCFSSSEQLCQVFACLGISNCGGSGYCSSRCWIRYFVGSGRPISGCFAASCIWTALRYKPGRSEWTAECACSSRELSPTHTNI
jgi:hypothetical protein